MLLSDLVDLIKKGNSNFISANICEDLNIDDAASLDAAVKHQISFLEEWEAKMGLFNLYLTQRILRKTKTKI